MMLARVRAIAPALALGVLFAAVPLTGCLQAAPCGPETTRQLEIVNDEIAGTCRFTSIETVESNLVDDWNEKYSLDAYHRPGVLMVLWKGLSDWEYVVSLSGLQSKTKGVFELSAYGAVACGCPGVLDLPDDSISWQCYSAGEWKPARCVPLTGKLTVTNYQTECADLGQGEICATKATLNVVGEGEGEGVGDKRDRFVADFQLWRDEQISEVPLNCD